MRHALDFLQRQIRIRKLNSTICEERGYHGQVALDRAIADDCQAALNVLLYANKARSVEELQGLDDDLEEVPLGSPHCGVDGPCESCQ